MENKENCFDVFKSNKSKSNDSDLVNLFYLNNVYPQYYWLSLLNINNKYEVNNAIALFLNFDIKGSVFGNDEFWFAKKESNIIRIAAYDYTGLCIGYTCIHTDEWYKNIKPLLVKYINAMALMYSIKGSSWYYDIDDTWKTTKYTESETFKIPDIKLPF